MNYIEIKAFSVENGTGVRVSLFVAGCRHRCAGCFNPETWDFESGKPFTEDVEGYIMELLRPSYIAGLTLLGGDPAEPESQAALLHLLQRIKKELPQKTVWSYSGYVYEDFLPGGLAYCDVTEEYLSYVDILVDGPFLSDLRDISLKFRGSGNQRIIDLNKTRHEKRVVLAME